MGVACGCNQWDAVNWPLMDKMGIIAVCFFPLPHYEHLKPNHLQMAVNIYVR